MLQKGVTEGVTFHAHCAQWIQFQSFLRTWVSVPVVKVLSNDQMFEMVINGSFIVLKQCVGVSQTVTGLSLHCLVLQKPGQLQSPPEGKAEEEEEEGQRMSRAGPKE